MRTLEDGCERWRMDANTGGWMRTLVPAPSRSAGDKWWEFGSAGGFGLNRRWATRYVPSPDEV
jgi:hypothetical protein